MNLDLEFRKLLFNNKQKGIFQMNFTAIQQDRIAVIAKNTMENLNLVINLLSANKLVIPIHPKMPTEEKQYLLSISDAELIITDDNYLKNEIKGIPVLSIDELYLVCKKNKYVTKQMIKVLDFPIIFFTSGTTGRPKAAVLKKDSLESLFCNMIKKLNVTSTDCLVMYTHISFIQSFWSALIVLLSGGRVILKDKLDYTNFFNELDYYNASITVGVPTMLNKIVRQHHSTIKPLKNLRCIISGGEILNVESIKELLSILTNTFIANAYGMVEMTAVCSLYYGRNPNIIDSVGTPLDDVQIEIRNKNINGIGNVFIRSSRMMQGYFPNTLEKKKNWFDSGDIGFFDDNDNLHIITRDSLVINKGGVKINPFEIEKIILSCEYVQDAFVEKIYDEIYGENFIVKIIAKDHYREDIVQHIKNNLTTYYMPKKITFVSKLLLTSSGKVQRKSL